MSCLDRQIKKSIASAISSVLVITISSSFLDTKLTDIYIFRQIIGYIYILHLTYRVSTTSSINS